MARALDLVLSNAVTLHLDGTASVQQGEAGAYTTAQGACSCPEMEELQAPCQHVLAAEIHRRTQALFQVGSTARRLRLSPCGACNNPIPLISKRAVPSCLRN